jgi:DNA-binding CsgD family transcriptional regulator
MFLVDAAGRIVHCNAAGRTLLSASDPLCTVGDRLAAGDPEANRQLGEILVAASHGDHAIGARGVSLPLTARGGENFVAHALPLNSGARRRAGAAYSATAALFVYKAALTAPSPPEVIARHYNLTPTELRVLLGIVNVGGVPEVAEALGVSVSTVRSHLAAVFEKTATGRQADLVKLVAAFSNPLFE